MTFSNKGVSRRGLHRSGRKRGRAVAALDLSVRAQGVYRKPERRNDGRRGDRARLARRSSRNSARRSPKRRRPICSSSERATAAWQRRQRRPTSAWTSCSARKPQRPAQPPLVWRHQHQIHEGRRCRGRQRQASTSFPAMCPLVQIQRHPHVIDRKRRTWSNDRPHPHPGGYDVRIRQRRRPRNGRH